jgi:hypothetical protein
MLKRKWSKDMAMIEIKDLNLASDVQDLQGEVLDLSTASKIHGGLAPYYGGKEFDQPSKLPYTGAYLYSASPYSASPQINRL